VISSLYMIPLAEEIAATGAEVHAIDLPGFGRSDGPREILSMEELADWVIAWMSESGIARCHVIGNSLGCEIAAHLAIKTPERVATVTMTGPTLDPQALAPLTQTLRLCRDALREPFSLWCNWTFDFFRAGARRAFGTTREMFRDHIECHLPHVTARTLVIRGGTDPTVPQSAAVILASLLPNGELLVIDGEPHCVHYTNARESGVPFRNACCSGNVLAHVVVDLLSVHAVRVNDRAAGAIHRLEPRERDLDELWSRKHHRNQTFCLVTGRARDGVRL
jgi:pimeloyl-ACP methyl ester carboxylesterase